MTLTKDGRGVIRLGDATTHGGKVISVAHTATVMGSGFWIYEGNIEKINT